MDTTSSLHRALNLAFLQLPYKQKLLAVSQWASVPREANLNWFCVRWLLEHETLAHRAKKKTCQIFRGLFNLPVEKENPTSKSLNTDVTVLVRALSLLAKLFFSWKLLMHIQKCKLEYVSFTGKKLITCNSCLWHSSTLVSSPSSGQRGWFLTVTSFVFWCMCTNNLRIFISDKGTPSSWAFVFHLKCKRLQN